MAIFMKFGSKKGDVDTKQFKEWIMLHSFQFGTGRGISSATASGGNRQGTHASVSEVTVTKNLDPASLYLWQDALGGKLNTKVEIAFTLADEDNSEYLRVTLFDTGISGWSISSGGDRPAESVSMNFSKIELKDMSKKKDGSAGDQLSVNYDLAQQTNKG